VYMCVLRERKRGRWREEQVQGRVKVQVTMDSHLCLANTSMSRKKMGTPMGYMITNTIFTGNQLHLLVVYMHTRENICVHEREIVCASICECGFYTTQHKSKSKGKRKRNRVGERNTPIPYPPPYPHHTICPLPAIIVAGDVEILNKIYLSLHLHIHVNMCVCVRLCVCVREGDMRVLVCMCMCLFGFGDHVYGEYICRHHSHSSAEAAFPQGR